jgi:hypothetical protein
MGLAARIEACHRCSDQTQQWSQPMKNRSDLNQSYAAFDQASTIVIVVD